MKGKKKWERRRGVLIERAVFAFLAHGRLADEVMSVLFVCLFATYLP